MSQLPSPCTLSPASVMNGCVHFGSTGTVSRCSSTAAWAPRLATKFTRPWPKSGTRWSRGLQLPSRVLHDGIVHVHGLKGFEVSHDTNAKVFENSLPHAITCLAARAEALPWILMKPRRRRRSTGLLRRPRRRPPARGCVDGHRFAGAAVGLIVTVPVTFFWLETKNASRS